MKQELLKAELYQNFNWEHYKKLSKFFNTPEEEKLMYDIYQLDVRMEVISEYVFGKHKDKPLKDPRYGVINEPDYKEDYLKDLDKLRIRMREALLEMHYTKEED